MMSASEFDLRHDLAIDPVVDRAQIGRELRDLPSGRILGEFEIDEPKMAAPESRHDGGLSVKRAGLHIDARNVGEFLAAREGEMLVAGEDHVDAVDLGEMQRRIFLAALAIAARDAGMAQRHHDVGARLLDVRHMFLRRVDDVDGGRLAVEMRLVPLDDLRRHEPDHADLDRVLGPPASSTTSRSRTSHGFCRVSPFALMTLAQTMGNLAAPSEFCRKSRP